MATPLDEIANGMFRTSDMTLAAYLATCGMMPDSVDQYNDESNACWIWENCSALMADRIMQYRCGAAMVGPKQYTMALRRVRDKLYAFQDGVRR